MTFGFSIWRITCPISVLAMLWPSSIQIPAAGLVIIHVGIFIWGIFNIRSQFFCRTYFHGPTECEQIALTFDDGPDPRLTLPILDILDAKGIKATFFLVATKVQRHPELAREIIDRGHTIACHDLAHSNTSNFRTTAPLTRDIGLARDIIHEATGKLVRLYRPPVGLMNPHVPVALKKLELDCIGWSRSAGEAGNRRLSRIEKISGLAREGAIVLLHDCLPVERFRQEILFQINSLCEDLVKQGLKPVSVDKLLGIEAYE